MDQNESILIAEYQRLSELKRVAIEEFNKRFDIYLTVFSAAIAGIVAILQFASGNLQGKLITFITVVMLVLGWNIFTSLNSANLWNIHLERATRLIQEKYIEREPSLSSYFYFHKPLNAIIGTKFSTLVVRGLSSGGQKSIVILANSAAFTYLLDHFWIMSHLDVLFLAKFRLAILLFIFLISCLFHVFYSWWFYRANGVH